MLKAKAAFDNASKCMEQLHAAELEACKRRDKTIDIIETGRKRLGFSIVDDAFFNLAHEDKHKAAPWFEKAVHPLREQVFVEAMNVHRAFLDVAARPIRHNLGALIGAMGGGDLGAPQKTALLTELWATLFLVIPVISTTFASVERMFRQIPPEAFGWLLIDEAGQALPPAAVGALMRSKRAIVVGDPLQIKPVVTLPSSLSESICHTLNIDPDRWNAPNASVQTLADAASKYVTEFQQENGSRQVGAPLLVHRRCQDPMFSVSNRVAYSGLMVKATGKRDSPIREILGHSAWINIEGSAQEKWSCEEGEQVTQMLLRLAKAGVLNPDIFVVTPFRIVAHKLRERLRSETRIFEGSDMTPSEWVYNRVGTVHTVQGREADSVIMVLGAPLPNQAGARAWAGAQPNIVNVAVTRAKENLYIVGSKKAWSEAGHFKQLANTLNT